MVLSPASGRFVICHEAASGSSSAAAGRGRPQPVGRLRHPAGRRLG
jgi:hypothetical protein